MSKKANATKLTNSREDILCEFLNTGYLEKSSLDQFSCSEDSLSKLYQEFQAAFPDSITCKKAGGLGKHVDILVETPSGLKGIEIKTSEKKIKPEVLTWHPWEGGVQFCQGQVKSALMSSFLGDCAMPMVGAWHQKLTEEIIKKKLPTFEVPTLEDYTKILFTISSHTKQSSPAAKLINELRSNEPLRKEVQQLWLQFEDEWFSSHQPNREAFQTMLQNLMGEKDYWININKSGAFLIEGFQVKGLTFLGTANKPEGGSYFHYSMKLQKKSGGDTQEVPFQLKFYWKNGGQGVQNINLLMVSD